MIERFLAPESTLIAEASYDNGQRVLEVTIRPQSVNDHEKTYVYGGVALTTWEEFSTARSKGAYFTRHIRPLFTGKLKE